MCLLIFSISQKHHYHELNVETQKALGSVPVGFTNYWISRFPNLLSHSYHSLELCSEEISFKSYYDKEYVFTKPNYLLDVENDNRELIQNYENFKNFQSKNSPQNRNSYRPKDNTNVTNGTVKTTRRGHYNFRSYNTNSDTAFITRSEMGKRGDEKQRDDRKAV